MDGSAQAGRRVVYTLDKGDRTLWAFMRSNAFARALMGPVGGGKTSCALMQIPVRAVQQQPSPIDGVRRSRWGVFRDTYRNLERTTIRTWHHWMPKETGEWRGGANGEPAIHRLNFALADGTVVDFEVMFIAVGDNDVEDVARGFELTGVMLNEADRLPVELFEYLLGRVGRYPEEEHGWATWSGIWCDFNAPDFDNWTYKKFVETPSEGFEFFQQPGGLDGGAENLTKLKNGRKYYERQCIGQPEWWVRRMVHNQFGYSREGQPVYLEDFSEKSHVSMAPIQPIPKKRLIVGMDAGRHPAAAVLQLSMQGQLRVLNEMVRHWMGAREFGRELRLFLKENYPDHEIIFIADPAAFNPTEISEDDEDVWVEIVGRQLGARVRPAKTQRADARREALRKQMKWNISAGVPGFIVDGTRCPTIRRGLNHTFRFKKIGNSESTRFSEKVDKNDDSHVCEACEYGALEAVGYDDVIGGLSRRRPMEVETDFRVPGF